MVYRANLRTPLKKNNYTKIPINNKYQKEI